MQETVLPGASAPFATLLYVLIPGLPFLGFLLNGLLNRKLVRHVGRGASARSPCWARSCCRCFCSSTSNTSTPLTLFDWISVGSLQIPFTYQVDQLSLIMLLLITGVGHAHPPCTASATCSHDENVGKFFSFLNLFVFSMLILVLGANFVILFIGWEGVGLVLVPAHRLLEQEHQLQQCR